MLEDQNNEELKASCRCKISPQVLTTSTSQSILQKRSRGHPVAIQRVKARDAEAALTLATRDVRTTIECLNFFADLIPYNRARLRIAIGQTGSGSSVQIASADDGIGQVQPSKTSSMGILLRQTS